MENKKLILENKRLIKENEFLNYFRDSSIGLYCIDRNPKEVTKKWIEKYAFRLT